MIVLYPSPVLNMVCSTVTNKKEAKMIKKRLESALDTTKHGIGLAAPQVGIPARAFVARIGGLTRFFCNPEIVHHSGVYHFNEGCLSIPGASGMVERHETISLRWFDDSMKEKRQNFTRLDAVVCQHEIDHLDGILFTSKTEHDNRGVLEALSLCRTLEEPDYPYCWMDWFTPSDSA